MDPFQTNSTNGVNQQPNPVSYPRPSAYTPTQCPTTIATTTTTTHPNTSQTDRAHAPPPSPVASTSARTAREPGAEAVAAETRTAPPPDTSGRATSSVEGPEIGETAAAAVVAAAAAAETKKSQHLIRSTRSSVTSLQLLNMIGNLEIGNQKLIETITLPITIGNWHCSRIRVIGNVVDSTTEPRQKTSTITFYNDIQKKNY